MTAVAEDGLNASGLVLTVFHFDFAAGVAMGVVERGLVLGAEERSLSEVEWRKVLRKVSCVD